MKYRSYIQTRDTNNEFLISQMATIYKFPKYTSTNAIIAIPSFGGGIYGDITNSLMTNGDAHQYWSLQGITDMSTVYVVFPNGATNDLSDQSSTLENTLDVSVVGSCCKSIIILFIFTNTTSFTESFQTMIQGIIVNGVQLIPTIISVSWGMPETIADPTDIIQANLLLKNTNINVCVATGDNGSSDGTTEITVDYPSSSPYVTSVGGTSLICPNNVYDASCVEVVWNDGITATGGGISVLFDKPSYQTFIPGTKRNSPDIAFNCDPNTGIQLYFNGNIAYGIGGTSLAAPFFAGFIALTGLKTFINPILYSNTCYHDITVGSNSIGLRGEYFAKPGFDNCTGLGSMDCSKFILNPYILLYKNITITIGQIIYIPIRTNVSIVWSSSNKNVFVANGYIKANSVGTAVVKASANNLFSIMNVTVISNMKKMLFTK
jgi:kumamolisin